jgi:hypothetical protein
MAPPRKAPRAKPAKRGRPTDYRPEYAEQVYKLCLLGAIDVEIADFFGVSTQTLNTWKHRHVAFLDSLKRGKQLADAEVAEKLFQRATGYSHPSVKIVADAKTGAEHIVPFTEHYPPDTTACIFWLKNRSRDTWNDKQIRELTGPDGERLIPLETLRAALRDADLEDDS